jgi:hypothetical protein
MPKEKPFPCSREIFSSSVSSLITMSARASGDSWCLTTHSAWAAACRETGQPRMGWLLQLRPEGSHQRRGSGISISSSIYPASLNETTSADRASWPSAEGCLRRFRMRSGWETSKVGARLLHGQENISYLESSVASDWALCAPSLRLSSGVRACPELAEKGWKT